VEGLWKDKNRNLESVSAQNVFFSHPHPSYPPYVPAEPTPPMYPRSTFPCRPPAVLWASARVRSVAPDPASALDPPPPSSHPPWSSAGAISGRSGVLEREGRAAAGARDLRRRGEGRTERKGRNCSWR
jgi:hypothetical protein